MANDRANMGSSCPLAFLFVETFVLCIGCRRGEEQFSSIWIGHIPAVGPFEGVVAGLVAINDDFGTYLKGLLRDAAAEQGIGTSPLDHPDIFRAVGIGHFNVNPG